MPDDLYYLQLALDDARASAAAGEVPIGAVLVHNDAVLVRSGNRTIRDNDPTAHAEIIVIREAARLLGNYRLAGTVLYVTLEPCAMCAGAIVQARVSRLVYAADDPKAAPSVPPSSSLPAQPESPGRSHFRHPRRRLCRPPAILLCLPPLIPSRAFVSPSSLSAH